MDEHAFRRFVADTLSALFDQMEEIESDDLEPTLSDGVVSCEFEPRGTFVLSQQVPLSELWLSANRKAWHFRWDGGAWVERDTGEDMLGLLSKLFGDKLGMKVSFRAPS